MRAIAILLLLLGMCTGCIQRAVRSDDSAFWGRSVESDGTEHVHMGDLSIKTRNGNSR